MKFPSNDAESAEKCTVYDWYFDMSKYRWALWVEKQKGYTIPPEASALHAACHIP